MTVTGRKATLLVGALIVSVCLNLFGIAAWATHELKHGSHRSSGYGIGRLVHSAPEEARETIKAQFEAAKPEIRERVKAVRKARADIARLMSDPNVDSAALETAFADLRRHVGEVEVLVHHTLIEAIVKIPADVRSRWAEDWRKRR